MTPRAIARGWKRLDAVRAAGIAVGALLLASCASSQTASTDLDAPIIGSAKPTTFIVSPADGTLHGRDLATVARILRRYKTLDAAERALVKSSLAKRLQGVIALEVQRLEIRHQAERLAIATLPDHALAAKRTAALDEVIRREATANVLRRLGKLVAVPLKTSDNRSAVAFATIGEKSIAVAEDAAEIDRPIASLVEGEHVQTQSGDVAAFVAAPPTAVISRR